MSLCSMNDVITLLVTRDVEKFVRLRKYSGTRVHINDYYYKVHRGDFFRIEEKRRLASEEEYTTRMDLGRTGDRRIYNVWCLTS